MIHPHTRLAVISEQVGLGVVATQALPRGTIVWVRDPLDRRIPADELAALHPLYRSMVERYCFWEADGDRVLCWDHGRFVNHSCSPTNLGGGFSFTMLVRDVAEGEELTDDYGTFGYAFPFQCTCGSPKCRGAVGNGLSPSVEQGWDDTLRSALPQLPLVEQPLWELVPDKDRVAAALAQPHCMPSHREHRPTEALRLETARRKKGL